MCSHMSPGWFGRGCHTRASTSCRRQRQGISVGSTSTVNRYWWLPRFTWRKRQTGMKVYALNVSFCDTQIRKWRPGVRSNSKRKGLSSFPDDGKILKNVGKDDHTAMRSKPHWHQLWCGFKGLISALKLRLFNNYSKKSALDALSVATWRKSHIQTDHQGS